MLNKYKIYKFFLTLCITSSLFLINNPVFAATTADVAAKPNAMGSIFMMLALFGGMYFLFIRPQQKRAKEHQTLLSSIVEEDEIVTTGGLMGKVTKVLDQVFLLTIANGVEVAVQKHAVAKVLPKNTLNTLKS